MDLFTKIFSCCNSKNKALINSRDLTNHNYNSHIIIENSNEESMKIRKQTNKTEMSYQSEYSECNSLRYSIYIDNNKDLSKYNDNKDNNDNEISSDEETRCGTNYGSKKESQSYILNFELIKENYSIDENFHDLIELLMKNELSKNVYYSSIDESKIISNEEKNIIKFNIHGCVEVYCRLINLPGYEILYQKENDPLFVRIWKEGWELNKKFYLFFHKYTMDISDILDDPLMKYSITLDDVYNLIYKPEILELWDKGIVKNNTLDMKTSNEENLTYMIFHREFYNPLPFSSNRERVDKQISFILNNRVFAMTSSINESEQYASKSKGVERMDVKTNIFSIYIHEKKIYYLSFNQVDAKMSLPDFLVKFTLPIQTKGWYVNFKKILKIYSIHGLHGLKNLKRN